MEGFLLIRKEHLINTIKISLAAIIAIVLAELLNINFAVSTGIVAILSIQPTKKETIITAMGRLLAFICALIISFVCYELAGYNLIGFGVYLICFILLCQIFEWYNAMAMNSVLISHFLSFGDMNIGYIINEVLIFTIGVSIGIVTNLTLKKNVDYMEELKQDTDAQIKMILNRMAQRILDNDISDYNGECFAKLEDSIRKAKNIAEVNFKNQLDSSDVFDKEYIQMRDKQCKVLYEMYKSIRSIQTTPISAKAIADFLEEMSQEYHQQNDGKKLKEAFKTLDDSMKNKPLPIERVEFEDRARLFVLLRYIEEFLNIKIEFTQKYQNS